MLRATTADIVTPSDLKCHRYIRWWYNIFTEQNHLRGRVCFSSSPKHIQSSAWSTFTDTITSIPSSDRFQLLMYRSSWAIVNGAISASRVRAGHFRMPPSAIHWRLCALAPAVVGDRLEKTAPAAERWFQSIARTAKIRPNNLYLLTLYSQNFVLALS